MSAFDRHRWHRVDALFTAALDQPPESRDAWLAKASEGDDDLLREVSALLRSLAPAAAAIGESADRLISDAGPLSAEAIRLEPGRRLGAYRIISELGRGGMGAVYLARRDDQAFDREVAIKIVGTASGALERRFAVERRILGALDHPAIARLYDSGTSDDGLPYLVMEYVPGVRIDRFAAEGNLQVLERLRLFVTVCQAVSYAHGRLVVHRDLKAGNILVTADGRVSLLDFGIAKLLDRDDRTDETASIHRVLTPEYASPEQFRGDPPSAAMDQYALGVLLHELLTGQRPAWQAAVAAGGSIEAIDAAMRPPSDCAPATARRWLRGELDVIVLTALAPDPARRYPSVAALAADVERVMAGHPIHARPAGAGIRALKFARRHPAGVAAAAAALLAAVAFLGATLLQSRRIARERDRAEAALARSEAVSRLLTGLFESADPFAPADPDSMSVSGYLAAGAARVNEDLAADPGLQAEMLAVLGGVYRALGRPDAASPLLEGSVDRRRTPGTASVELAMSLQGLGRIRVDQGRHREADSLLTEALERLGPDARSRQLRPSVQADRALALTELSQFDSAAALFDEALRELDRAGRRDTTLLVKILNDRGYLASRMGDNATALSRSREAYDLNAAQLGSDHPTTLVIQSNLAFQLDQAGKWAESIPLHRHTVEGLRRRLGPAHPNVSGALRNLSAAQSRAGAHADAIATATEATEIDRGRLNGRHLGLAITLDYLAGAYEGAGRPAEALPALAEGYRLHVELAGPSSPETAIARSRWAGARCRSGNSRAVQIGALPDFRAALAVLDQALPEAHPQRIARHIWYGACLDQVGRAAEAERELAAQLELALAHHEPGDQIVRIASRELLRHLRQVGDPARLARLEGRLDSLGVVRDR